MSRLPDVSPQGWRALHACASEPFEAALASLGEASRRRGAWERMEGGEDSVVFARGDVVVKLVPPFSRRDAERETLVLPRLALPVPTPRVLDVQRIDGWTAVLLSRLPGVPAAHAWSTVPHAERLDVARTLGGTLRALWATPLDPSDGDAIALHARLVADAGRHAADGLRDAGTFVLERLPASPPAPTLVHLDLTDENVLLERREGRWRVSGVLDFVASRASYPPLDLVTPGIFFGGADASVRRALVLGSGIELRDPRELAGWHAIHPFASLPRDLARGGASTGTPVEAALDAMWSLG